MIIGFVLIWTVRVFPGSKWGGGGTVLIMCTMYLPFNWLKQKIIIHAKYYKCYSNYMIEENDNYSKKKKEKKGF